MLNPMSIFPYLSAKKFFGDNAIAKTIVPNHLEALHQILGNDKQKLFGIRGSRLSGKSHLLYAAALCRTVKMASDGNITKDDYPNAGIVFSSAYEAAKFINYYGHMLADLFPSIPITPHPNRRSIEIGNCYIYCFTRESEICPLNDPEQLSSLKLGLCVIDGIINSNDKEASNINDIISYSKLTPTRIALAWETVDHPYSMFDALVTFYWNPMIYHFSYKDLKGVYPQSAYKRIKCFPY